MASLKDIRLGLKANIDAAFPNAQCTGYLLSAPTTTSFEIELDPEGIDPHQAARNGVEIVHMIVRAVVADTLDLSTQMRLDEFIDTGSVRAAIEADQTLGGAASTLLVTKVAQGGYRSLVFGDNPATRYLTCEWAVQIYAAGT